MEQITPETAPRNVLILTLRNRLYRYVAAMLEQWQPQRQPVYKSPPSATQSPYCALLCAATART
ncbi:MAG: hypothetical protein EPO28_01285 [Saprospiraceae bacterium]|nr:MAG: hypothetical protein EPO28_01285 [Saprospiraceae bacterium]